MTHFVKHRASPWTRTHTSSVLAFQCRSSPINAHGFDTAHEYAFLLSHEVGLSYHVQDRPLRSHSHLVVGFKSSFIPQEHTVVQQGKEYSYKPLLPVLFLTPWYFPTHNNSTAFQQWCARRLSGGERLINCI